LIRDQVLINVGVYGL